MQQITTTRDPINISLQFTPQWRGLSVSAACPAAAGVETKQHNEKCNKKQQLATRQHSFAEVKENKNRQHFDNT